MTGDVAAPQQYPATEGLLVLAAAFLLSGGGEPAIPARDPAMVLRLRLFLALVLAGIGFSSSASAFDPAIGPAEGVANGDLVVEAPAATDTLAYNRGGIFDELRVGGFGFVQNNDDGTEDGVFIGGQVLFDPLPGESPNAFIDALLSPRPHLGGLAALDEGTSQVFAGVTWEFPITQVFFIEASFGGTVHDGELHEKPGLNLGCRVLFREGFGVGANLGQHFTLTASVDHSSHASLCDDSNDGLTHVGASLGYRF